MTLDASPLTEGLFGCGTLRDCDGEPLRPGGLALTRELIALAGFCAGDRVADVGCGFGASTQLMLERGVNAIGVDCAATAARADAPPFVIADAAHLPFVDGGLDGVLAECSLSLTVDRSRTLGEWSRALKSGGRLALSDVYRRSGGATGAVATRETLCAEVAATGFLIVRFEDRSETLKSWAARFIFEHGSLDALWSVDCAADERATRKARLGYGLLVAVKHGERAGAGG